MSDLDSTALRVEPVLVAAGTTWKWNRAYTNYPNSTFTLKYYFREVRGVYSLDVTAAADTNGSGFIISVPKATTELVTPGIYAGRGYVEDATDRYLVYDNQIEVMADFKLVSEGEDLRTHNAKVLEQIKALLENKFVDDSQSYSIAGRSLTKMTPTELYTHKLYYEQQVIAENRRARAKQNLPTGQTIYGVFNNGL
tara:strand:+ start:737 stop:1324 length:588 start_codon:yes stop_codon:yes gene_type:complete